MKNKGREHKAGSNANGFSGIGNCKGTLVADTRDIRKMGKNPFYVRGVSKKFTKRKWSKRVRGYFKSQTKNIGFDLIGDNIMTIDVIVYVEKDNEGVGFHFTYEDTVIRGYEAYDQSKVDSLNERILDEIYNFLLNKGVVEEEALVITNNINITYKTNE